MSDKIRILLIEDDELFRLWLQLQLQQEPEFEVILADKRTAIDLAKQQALKIVVLDIGLTGIEGIEVCRRIKQSFPRLPILILTPHSQASCLARLIRLGVQGYCFRGVPTQTLILAIRSICAGASWWNAIATAKIRDVLQKATPIKKTDQTESRSSLKSSQFQFKS